MTNDVCNNCNTEQLVLCLDSSDNEYGYIRICKKCALSYFDNDKLENTDICRRCDTVCKMSELVETKKKVW